MIDTGASQNYMSPRIVQYLGLKKKYSGAKEVILADGKRMTTN